MFFIQVYSAALLPRSCNILRRGTHEAHRRSSGATRRVARKIGKFKPKCFLNLEALALHEDAALLSSTSKGRGLALVHEPALEFGETVVVQFRAWGLAANLVRALL